METKTDEQLMAHVAAGDPDALSILFDRHHRHLFNFLFRMSGDRLLSEDLCQDVFIKMMRYRESYRNGKFLSWMFTIARNQLSSAYGSRKYRNHEALEVHEYRLHDEEDAAEDHSHLHHALAQLDPPDRELLVLNRLQRIRYAEMAEILGITEGAVKTRVNRALKKLKHVYFDTL